MTSKAEIIAALPGLSQGDLAIIRATCDHLLGVSSEPSGDQVEVSGESLLYDALIAQTSTSLPYHKFKQTDSYRHWQRNTPVVLDFIDRHFADVKANRILTLALMRFLIRMVVLDLSKRDLNYSLGAVVLNLARVPFLFDEQFPSYRESNLTGLITMALKRG